MKKRLLLVTLAIFIASYPYLAGLYSKWVYLDAVTIINARLPQHLVSLENNSYEGGFLDARAETTLKLFGEFTGKPTTEVRYLHTFNHLPDWEHGAIATVTTQIMLSEQSRSRVYEFIGDDEPLVVTTYIRPNGSQYSTFSSPSFAHSERPGTLFKWSGMEGTLTAGAQQERYQLDLLFPGMTAQKGTAEKMLTKDWALYIEASQEPEYGLWLGHGSFTMDSLHGTIHSSATGELATFAMDGYKIGYSQLQGERGIDTRLEFELEQFSASKLTNFSDLRIALSSHNMDIEVTAELMAAYYSMMGGDPTGLMAIAGQRYEYTERLFNNRPSVAVEQFHVNTEHGALTFSAGLEIIKPWDPVLRDQPQRIIDYISVTASLSADLTLIEHFYRQGVRSRLQTEAVKSGQPLGPQELEQRVGEVLRQKPLREAIEVAGMATLDGDTILMDVEYRPGQLMINGEERPELLEKLIAQ